MKIEWIIGGVLLLVCALIFKKMQSNSAFQNLVMAFIFVWSALVAVHLWNLSCQVVGFLPLENLKAGELTVIAYWFGLAMAVFPGFLLVKLWLKSYSAMFPPLIDSCILWVSTLSVAITFICLVLMTLAPFVTADRGTPSGKVYYTLRLLPIKAYLRISDFSASSGEHSKARRALLREPIRNLLTQ